MYVCLKQVANVYVCLRARSVYVWMSEAPEHVCMSQRAKIYVCMDVSDIHP